MGTTVAARRTALTELVEPIVTTSGFELEEMSLTTAGRRTVVRVVIDSDAGVTLDDAATVSRAISGVLDEQADGAARPELAGSYTLEVSSVGVDRPIKSPRRWRRNIGRLVRVRIGSTMVVGRVRSADDSEVALEIDDQLRQFRYDELSAGTVQVEFDRGEGGGA